MTEWEASLLALLILTTIVGLPAILSGATP